MDEVFELLKAHYQYVLIAAGLLFLIGAIREWRGNCYYSSQNKRVNESKNNS